MWDFEVSSDVVANCNQLNTPSLALLSGKLKMQKKKKKVNGPSLELVFGSDNYYFAHKTFSRVFQPAETFHLFSTLLHAAPINYRIVHILISVIDQSLR